MHKWMTILKIFFTSKIMVSCITINFFGPGLTWIATFNNIHCLPLFVWIVQPEGALHHHLFHPLWPLTPGRSALTSSGSIIPFSSRFIFSLSDGLLPIKKSLYVWHLYCEQPVRKLTCHLISNEMCLLLMVLSLICFPVTCKATVVLVLSITSHTT